MSVMDSFQLTGRVALVTGGAGLFGRQIVEALAEAGARVYMASRNRQTLDQEAGRLQAAGLAVETAVYDQGDGRSIEALRDEIAGRAGRLDILVNNAVMRGMKDWDSPAEQFAESLAVNATGLFRMHQVFGRVMAEQGGGSIINVGSIQGMVGPDFHLYEDLDFSIPPDYFFHKGGLVQLTRYAAARLAPRGVRVNAIAPGGFYNRQDPRFVERYCRHTYLGRMANDTDLKGVVVFLASAASAYVTGANIPVDGGYTAN